MPRPRRPAGVFLLIVCVAASLAAAGCTSADHSAIPPTHPDAPPGAKADGPRTPDAPPAEASADAGPWTLHAREVTADRLGPPVVEATITWARSAPTARNVTLTWSDDGAGSRPQHHTTPPGATTTAARRTIDAAIGVPTTVTVTAEAASVIAAVDVVVTRWGPLTLVLNASRPYSEGQNTFHETLRVPFAPWADDPGHHILERAAAHYGFALVMPYREDLDSYFVDAINGTGFRWEEPLPGVGTRTHSRNWMVLLDDEAEERAIDDTFPALGQVLELRFVRCDFTGACEGLDG